MTLFHSGKNNRNLLESPHFMIGLVLKYSQIFIQVTNMYKHSLFQLIRQKICCKYHSDFHSVDWKECVNPLANGINEMMCLTLIQ